MKRFFDSWGVTSSNQSDLERTIPFNRSQSENDTIKLLDVPISALGHECSRILSLSLKSKKVILCRSGQPRDWRGVLSHFHIKWPQAENDPMGELLQMPIYCETTSMNELLRIFKEIDRWDVIADTVDLFVQDAIAYREAQSQLTPPNKDYNVFILAADADSKKVNLLRKWLESKQFQICSKDDLLGGMDEPEEIRELITRSKRIIVVLTPDFVKSPANVAFASFAASWGIDKCKRMVIPCFFADIKEDQIPKQYSNYHALRYNPKSKFCNFWEKLENSIKYSPEHRENQLRNAAHHRFPESID